MIKTLKPYIVSEEDRERMEWADWRFNSHYWIERLEGILECKYCKRQHSSYSAIFNDYPLCTKNPNLKELKYDN